MFNRLVPVFIILIRPSLAMNVKILFLQPREKRARWRPNYQRRLALLYSMYHASLGSRVREVIASSEVERIPRNKIVFPAQLGDPLRTIDLNYVHALEHQRHPMYIMIIV